MSAIQAERTTVNIDGQFVVFLIGFRINKIWKPHKWIPVARAMFRMLRELDEHPEIGCLGFIRHGFTIRQYWRSFDHLERYARDRQGQHWPAWVAFNNRMSACRGDVGIWHETFLVEAGAYEALYSGMPKYGLGKCGVCLPVGGPADTSRGRLTLHHAPNTAAHPGDGK